MITPIEREIVIEDKDLPDQVLGIKLNPLQRQRASKGEQVFLENMLHPDGRLVDGKVNFYKAKDGSVDHKLLEKMQVLEIPDTIRNHKLTKKEKEDLLDNKIVSLKDKSNLFFLQFDRDINQVTVRTEKEIGVPNQIGGYNLTDKDKELFVNHEVLPPRVFFNPESKSYFVASIRLTEDKKGISYSNYKDISETEAKNLIERLNKPKIIENLTSLTDDFIKTLKPKEEILDKSKDAGIKIEPVQVNPEESKMENFKKGELVMNKLNNRPSMLLELDEKTGRAIIQQSANGLKLKLNTEHLRPLSAEEKTKITTETKVSKETQLEMK